MRGAGGAAAVARLLLAADWDGGLGPALRGERSVELRTDEAVETAISSEVVTIARRGANPFASACAATRFRFLCGARSMECLKRTDATPPQQRLQQRPIFERELVQQFDRLWLWAGGSSERARNKASGQRNATRLARALRAMWASPCRVVQGPSGCPSGGPPKPPPILMPRTLNAARARREQRRQRELAEG